MTRPVAAVCSLGKKTILFSVDPLNDAVYINATVFGGNPMAMTKAEKANVESLETHLAFRWPTEPEPARSIRAASPGETVEGWDFNTYSSVITRTWSTSISHGTVHDGKKSVGSQGSRALYATEREALVALRWALCRKYAAELRKVDLRMEVAA